MDATTLLDLVRRQQDSDTHVGAAPPPPGVVPNFDNPEHAVSLTSAYAAGYVGIAFATLFLIMRVYTKSVLKHTFGWDDVTIILAWVLNMFISQSLKELTWHKIFAVGAAVCALSTGRYGMGRHIWNIPIDMMIPHLGQYFFACSVLYPPAVMFAKLSILIFYLRISPVTSFRIAVYATMGLVISYAIATTLPLLFACKPIKASWDLTVVEKKCIDTTSVYMATVICNMVSDFIILLLPLPMIKGLQKPLRQKVFIGALFSVGSLACIVSIVRVKLWVETPKNSLDFTWIAQKPGLWGFVETNLAVCCGCLMAFRPFVTHFWPSLIGASRNSDRNKQQKKKQRTTNRIPTSWRATFTNKTRLDSQDHALDEWDKTARLYDDEHGRVPTYREKLATATVTGNDEEIARPEICR